MANDDDVQRLISTPDSYRDRAQSAAGLIATAAAVIAAGSVLGNSAQLRGPLGFFAIAALVLLLGSLAFYLSAAQYRRDDDVPASKVEEAVKEITAEIHRRMKIGGRLGILALVAFLGLVVLAVWQPGQETLALVSVEDSAGVAGSGECELAPDGGIVGYVRQQELSAPSQLLRIRAANEECRGVILFVPSIDVRMIIKLDG